MSFARKIAIAAVASVIGLLALVGGVFTAMNSGITSEDSGVTACKEIVANINTPSTTEFPTKMTEEQRLEKRKPFENSQYEDLKSAGTGFVDAVYKVDNLDTASDNPDSLVAAGEELGTALGATTLLTSYYGLLDMACGNHGVDLPSIDS